MTERDVPQPWRYEIRYGPNEEANYAFVFDETGSLVSNLKINHAVRICETMNSATRSDDLVEALREIAGLTSPSFSSSNHVRLHKALDTLDEARGIARKTLAAHEQGKASSAPQSASGDRQAGLSAADGGQEKDGEGCPGYWPDYQAMGDCVHCGRTQADHQLPAAERDG